MTDEKQGEQLDLGVFTRSPSRMLGASEIIALVLSGLWLVACLVYFVVLGGGSPDARMRCASSWC